MGKVWGMWIEIYMLCIEGYERKQYGGMMCVTK
jgi:hypothetical protein